jgi:hypothetical protein
LFLPFELGEPVYIDIGLGGRCMAVGVVLLLAEARKGYTQIALGKKQKGFLTTLDRPTL